MFFRHLVAKTARPSWRVAIRGKKDLPIWRPPSFSDFFRRPSRFDDPWFRDFWGPLGSRNMDDFMKEQMRRMEAMFRMSPWRILEESEARAHGKTADIVEAKFTNEGLHLEMNVSHFAPDDIAVKLSGNRLVISGKHSSKADEHGFVSRKFTREFLIPEEIDTDTLSCRLTDEGHLVVMAKGKGETGSSRNITIERESGDMQESENKTTIQEPENKTKEKE